MLLITVPNDKYPPETANSQNIKAGSIEAKTHLKKSSCSLLSYSEMYETVPCTWAGIDIPPC